MAIRLFAAVLVALAAGQVQATEPSQKALNEVCKASLISQAAAKRTARELGITRAQRERLMCNEMTMVQFAQQHTMNVNDLPATAAGNETTIVNIQ